MLGRVGEWIDGQTHQWKEGERGWMWRVATPSVLTCLNELAAVSLSVPYGISVSRLMFVYSGAMVLVQMWQEANAKMKVNMQAFVRGCVWLRDNEDGAIEDHRVIRPQCKSDPKRWRRGILDCTQHPGLHTASWTSHSILDCMQHPGLHTDSILDCTQHPRLHTASWTAWILKEDQAKGSIRRSPGLPRVTMTASLSCSGTGWDNMSPSGSVSGQSCFLYWGDIRCILLAHRGRASCRPVSRNSCLL